MSKYGIPTLINYLKCECPSLLPALEATLAENEKMREALKPFTSLQQCTCHKAYKDRGLEQPDCFYHNWESEIEAARAALETK